MNTQIIDSDGLGSNSVSFTYGLGKLLSLSVFHFPPPLKWGLYHCLPPKICCEHLII